MKDQGSSNLGALSMRDLLRLEVETQARVMIDCLLALEKGPLTEKQLEPLMRAAHSIKGGGRIASLGPVVDLAHVMEDLFAAARAGRVTLDAGQIDVLMQAVDLLGELAQAGVQEQEVGDVLTERTAATRESVLAIAAGAPSSKLPGTAPTGPREAVIERPPARTATSTAAEKAAEPSTPGRKIRVDVERMDRLTALVGELSVKDKLAESLRTDMLQTRRRVREIQATLDGLRNRLTETDSGTQWVATVDELAGKVGAVAESLARGAGALETDAARTTSIVRNMQREVIAHRMQPFGDAAQGFRRLVRRLESELGKQVAIEVSGLDVGVDRDILERLNAPLTHLIQNAVDHGLEPPEERVALGKPATGTLTLSAQHRGGLLSIAVEDDGRGINLDHLREIVVARRLVTEAVASSLQEEELIEFLFLPNFTLRERVSEISGRGVGLDVVRNMLQQVRGGVRVMTRVGRGTRFEIRLPVTLIVVRCLIVAVADELFALPLMRISATQQVTLSDVQSMENRQYLTLDGHPVGLVSAAEVLELPGGVPPADRLSVVVLSKGGVRYGLVVDRLIGERRLVEKPIDPRLGKVEDVSSMAMLDDGSVALILDVDDLLHSIERLASGRTPRRVGPAGASETVARRKRVLVVDDSITVREVERGLLTLKGFAVGVAVDGADGWNALTTQAYDLVVSDVDMPRMDGIELVRLIRSDNRLKSLPVVIVSYKDREEDKLRGLDAGADRYLTKGSFQDDTFVDSVVELIGPPDGD